MVAQSRIEFIPLSNCDLIHCLPFLLNGYWDSIGKVLCEKNAR